MFFLKKYLDTYMPKVKNCEYVQFEKHHLDNLEAEELYGSKQMSNKARKENIIRQSMVSDTVVSVVNGDAVAIFGCYILWPGVAEAWSLFDPKARRYPIAMSKGAFAFFDIVTILNGLHRMQITVKKNDIRALSWAHYLGFVVEGELKSYSADKEDYFMMRRN